MKLFRFGQPGQEKPGAVDRDGSLRDLSQVIDDWTVETVTSERMPQIVATDLQSLPLVPDGTRLGQPLAGIRQFFCVGLNYRKHAEESGNPIPKEPLIFNKSISCLSGPNDDVPMPEGSQAMDWEVELGFVIGKTAYRVSEKEALACICGYALCNDVSERDWQIKRTGQWVKGKSFPGFGPIGPWFVTSDELKDPQNVPVKLSVNGEKRQDSNTADMIFTVAQIVAHMSEFTRLEPGDLVITGTPEGVGLGMKPPMFLKRGDVMELDGGPLGRQRQKVV